MEADGQRLYSVLTRTEVREKMMKEIVQISEVFSLSQSDATVVLICLRWNPFKVSDLLGDDKEKFLAELGLVNVFDSNPNEPNASCAHGDYLVSTPFCSHKFCTTCWRDYLSESLEKKKKKKKKKDDEEEKLIISCLNQDCVASVGPDTIEQLTVLVKEMYESYVLGSFVDGNNETIKWCPAPGCDYAIERHGEDVSELDFGVVCLCGHTFCWSCQLESHRPVTCNNASLWWTHLLDQSKSVSWISANTKRCPACNGVVHTNDDPDVRLVTCICSCSFCWHCLRLEEEHIEGWHCFEVSIPLPQPRNDYALTHHVNLWLDSDEEMEISKCDLKAMEQKSIPKLTESCDLGEQDIRALREAFSLVVQCRLVLKWSCVFDYFITDYHSAKKQYLDHLRKQATANLLKHKETVEEVMNLATSGRDIAFFKHILRTTTTATGNYFHDFVKTLEDGLSDVKVDACEDATTGYWFCDRCTFQNDSFDRECKVCVLPSHVALGNNNTSASAHHQQVPNNPVALQGSSDDDDE
ncbi:hypothetical protein EUTSA_v10015828mg [Eutrema salsugineum]|uniref:RBR-type E3 ubiquitin transferase n=1 Tax=Eutrema salsugineum TaxID=72664 RepID=V4LEJ8_EUTSA|nr:probable E3 ubiquitin-protein ligase ARI16 [Eutrema salsugineum]ESQ40837.1 hypothetical protein EUTSA_v10015828mg [Eutrema salsugineum]